MDSRHREFIWCKAKEEKKANGLRDAGFDGSIDGEGSISIQYQNTSYSAGRKVPLQAIFSSVRRGSQDARQPLFAGFLSL